jgi:hypothetical protein
VDARSFQLVEHKLYQLQKRGKPRKEASVLEKLVEGVKESCVNGDRDQTA